ncbi:MAG: DUF1501 domain-containing protein [Myxococcota bacterium]
MERREFLRQAMRGGLAVAGFAAGSKLLSTPSARSASWGEFAGNTSALAIPESQRAKNVLEVFLDGGLSPWETFYAIDDEAYGKATGEMWWTFQEGLDSVASALAGCGSLVSGPMLQPFAVDALGAQVNLGPFVHPLRSRADLEGRLRLHVVSHNVFPHMPAVALASSGMRLGQPRLAGLGTLVQRGFAAQGPLTRPVSYVIGEEWIDAFQATGLHPAHFRPVGLRVSELQSFVAALNATNQAEAQHPRNPLLDLYMSRFGSGLVDRSRNAPSRAPVLRHFEAALEMRERLPALESMLAASVPELGGGLEVCDIKLPFDTTRRQLELAASLLNTEPDGARYVLIDDNAYEVGAADHGYDTHLDHTRVSARKVLHFFRRLAEMINEPGEHDPRKIDLDRTMVVINTEFGRSPGSQDGSGRNHYPTAYVTAMLGGPVGPDQRGIVGAIDSEARPVSALQPAESRAAILMALGINPLDHNGFSQSDIADVDSERDALVKLREVVLGVPL